jgi:UDP-N-acetylmuramoyl-tripeptide--D-alanyl-D-alanine ligase
MSALLIAEFTALEIAGAVSGRLVSGSADRRFSQVSTDTRTIPAGALFVAIRGERFDGHAFVEAALEKGAAGAVVQKGLSGRAGGEAAIIEVNDTLRALGDLARFLRRAHPVPLAAVTGSNGKTTTKELLYSVLTAAGLSVLKSEGNFNNLIGVPLTLFRLCREHQAAVIEMGMNSFGEIARLCEVCEPDVALITSVAAAHTEGLGDIAGVARAKGELFAGLKSEATAVVNLDDPNISGLRTPARRLTFSAEVAADVRGRLLADRGLDGLDFELATPQGKARVHLALLGRHNLLNALAAASAAHAMGVKLSAIAAGIAGHRPFARRLQPTLAPGGWWVLNDAYNANPASMAAGLATAAQVARGTKGRLFAALGEMLELGALSDEAHRGVGRLCAALGAHALAYLDSGAGALYGEGAVAAGLSKDAVLPGEDAAEITAGLQVLLRPGDVVFIKGSRRTGMERVAEALLSPEGGPLAARPRAAAER